MEDKEKCGKKEYETLIFNCAVCVNYESIQLFSLTYAKVGRDWKGIESLPQTLIF